VLSLRKHCDIVTYDDDVHWHMRSCMRAGGRLFEHMLQNYCLLVLYGSSERFMKLSMQFGAFDGYFVVNVKS